jgi:hypothetical protein
MKSLTNQNSPLYDICCVKTTTTALGYIAMWVVFSFREDDLKGPGARDCIGVPATRMGTQWSGVWVLRYVWESGVTDNENERLT